jgi:catalase (peroxidase I)
MKFHKITFEFYNHLKISDSYTFHHKALPYREMNPEQRYLSQQVLALCSQTQTDPTESQNSNTIRPNQVMRKQKKKITI